MAGQVFPQIGLVDTQEGQEVAFRKDLEIGAVVLVALSFFDLIGPPSLLEALHIGITHDEVVQALDDGGGALTSSAFDLLFGIASGHALHLAGE